MSNNHYPDNKLENVTNSLERSALSEKNIRELKQMKKELIAQGLSDLSVSRILGQFRALSSHIDFYLPDASRDQLVDLVSKINQDKVNDREHSIWTLTEYKKALKSYYRWKTGEQHPDCLGFMRTHPKESQKPKIDNEELLDTGMVEKFINQASNPRDKALLALLWDSGARISELLSLEWRDLVFKEDNLISVRIRNGKNRPRKIFVTESVPLLIDWRDWKMDYTDIEPDMPVFTNYRPYSSHKRMSYRNARKQISKISDEVDIPDRVKTNPHAWRKARATDMASKGMTQPNMNAYFGWAPGSEVSGYYIRLANRDLEKQVRNIYPGLEEITEEGPNFLGKNIDGYPKDYYNSYACEDSGPNRIRKKVIL